jgi:hypothetical protein
MRFVRYTGTNRTVLARGDAAGMELMRRTGDGIYATGEFRDVGGIRTGNLALWTGDHWAPVGPGSFQGLTDEATTLAIAGTNVYAAGAFGYAGSNAANHIARWDGRTWHPLGSGIDGTIAQVATRGTDLFVVGSFDSAGGVEATNVARWDGATWSSLGNGLTGKLTAIAVSDLYVWVGREVTPTGLVVSRWDGNVWNDVATGAFGYGEILALLATDDSILVGGRFDRIDGIEVNNIALWESGQWHALNGGLTGHGPWMPNDFPLIQVRALLRDGTNLYVGGSFTNAGSVPAMNVARWDGAHWSALGEGIPGFGSCLFGSCVYPVTSLAMVQGQLFAGGGFTSELGSRPQGFLARWDGTSWANAVEEGWTLDEGLPYRYISQLHVWALAARGSDLYVAGNFAAIGTIPSYGFGVWHDSAPLAVHARVRAGRLILACAGEFRTAVIESTDSLTSPTWSLVPEVKFIASQTDPDQVEVELTPSLSQSFYRLRWPE